tara:strand:- start:1254 stop:1697 length:444 start_codon:yes stop_codon:yes gene_type:complete
VDKRIKKSQEKLLRAITHEHIEKNLAKMSLPETLKKIYAGTLSKEVSAALKTTYPTKRVEISKISVVNSGNLMEIPPEDDELERILEEAEKGTGETKSKNEEKPEEESSDDEIDYQTMKVAELKVLLKEKELPVSGTKAELIERLQT